MTIPPKYYPLFLIGVGIGFIMAMTEPRKPVYHWREL